MTSNVQANRAFSRRLFLKTALAAVSTAGLGSLLAACAASPAAPPATPSPVAATTAPAAQAVLTPVRPAATAAATVGAAKAKRGDTLRIALPSFAESTSMPNKAISLMTGPTGVPLEYACYLDPDDILKLAPGLAESFSTDDMKKWTFKIRKGVLWDKGNGEVTADDLANTFTLIARNDAAGRDTTYWRQRIKNMKVVDPYTLTFTFDTIEPDLAYQMSPWAQSPIVCKKYIETAGEEKADREPVGSGPFRMTKHEIQTQADFEAVAESHWRRPPMWDKINFVSMPEDSTRYAMLQTDRADVVQITSDQLGQAQKEKRLILPSAAQMQFGLTLGGLWPTTYKGYTGTECYQDVRVREAMNLAIDRKAINQTYFGGLGTYEPTPANHVAPLTVTASRPIPFDLDRAKQLMKESGKQGAEVKLITFPTKGITQMSHILEAVAGWWDEIGLKPTITAMDENAYAALRQDAKNSGLIGPWGYSVNPTYQVRFEKFFYSKTPSNIIYGDAHLDSIYEELKVTGDPSKREKMLADAEMYMMFEKWAAVAILNVPMQLFAANPNRIASWWPSSTGLSSYFENIAPKL